MQLHSVALMTVLARSILVASLATEAQQATTVSRIGWLHPGLIII